MLHNWSILLVGLAYLGMLFAVATWGDRLARGRPAGARRPVIYALSLGVYCTSWTYFGSVGIASRTGLDFLPIYLGPILVFALGWPLLQIDRRHRQAPEHRLDRRFHCPPATARARRWAPWWRSSPSSASFPTSRSS